MDDKLPFPGYPFLPIPPWAARDLGLTPGRLILTVTRPDGALVGTIDVDMARNAGKVVQIMAQPGQAGVIRELLDEIHDAVSFGDIEEV
jgi:hypothetical protein